jgi:hypothetical protein
MTPPTSSPRSPFLSAVREFSVSFRSVEALVANTVLAFVSVPVFISQFASGHLELKSAANVAFCGCYFAYYSFGRSHVQSLRHLWAYAAVFAAFSAIVSTRAVNPGAEMAPCVGGSAIAFFLWQWMREDSQKPAESA